MNPRYVTIYLIGKGYKEYPVKEENCVAHLQKRMDVLPFCKTNEKSPAIDVKIYKRDQDYESVEFTLRAETQDGLWVGLVVYGLDFLEVEKKIDMIEEKLKKAWVAINI